MAKEQLYAPSTIAKLFGFDSVRSVDRLAQDGVITPIVTKDKNNRDVRRYELIPTTQAYIRHLRRKIESRGLDDTRLDAISEADLRYRIAKADKMELEAKELKGEMHRAEDVEAVVGDLVRTIRAVFISLPGRLAVDTAAAQTPAEASDAIRIAVNEALETLSNYQYDPQEYEKRVRERKQWRLQMDPEEEAADLESIEIAIEAEPRAKPKASPAHKKSTMKQKNKATTQRKGTKK